jgi:hypothetical protein
VAKIRKEEERNTLHKELQAFLLAFWTQLANIYRSEKCFDQKLEEKIKHILRPIFVSFKEFEIVISFAQLHTRADQCNPHMHGIRTKPWS